MITVSREPPSLDIRPCPIYINPPQVFSLDETIITPVSEPCFLIARVRVMGGDDHHARYDAHMRVVEYVHRHRHDRFKSVLCEELLFQDSDVGVIADGAAEGWIATHFPPGCNASRLFSANSNSSVVLPLVLYGGLSRPTLGLCRSPRVCDSSKQSPDSMLVFPSPWTIMFDTANA